MKKLFLSLSLLTLSAGMVMGPTFFTVNAFETNAASSTKSVPSGYTNHTLTKTIDLNPCTEAEVREYYSSLEGGDYSGTDLLKALKPILMHNQEYHSYDDGKNVWKAYEITDRDWTLSPASSTTYGTYDPSTNKITNYQYGESGTNPRNNPYQHLFYRNRGVEAGYHRAWDHHGDNNGTDREHIWPKSRGFGKDSQNIEYAVPGARGDLHHLVAGDSYVNSSTHSNNPYGFVKMDTVTDDAGAKFKINGTIVVAGNYRGKALNVDSGAVEVFEPQDCDKGDIARACFYMVARYNNLAGNDPVIDAGNPNLTLDDTVSTATEISTASKAVSLGVLRDLLAWNRLDPPDAYEIYRNDLIYRNYDKNRNPFIDFPDWAEVIWGNVEMEADGRTVKARNTAPKGVAKPSTATLNAFAGSEPSSSSSAASSSQSSASSQASSAISSAPVVSSATSSGQGGSGGLPLPLPVIIAIVAGVALVVIILIVIAIKGKGKSKKAARKVLKKAVKGQNKKSSGKKKK